MAAKKTPTKKPRTRAEDTPERREAMATIAENLKNYRTAHGMSLRDMGDKCGVERTHIARMESGTVMPSLDSLLRVAVSFKIPLSTFLKGVGPSK